MGRGLRLAMLLVVALLASAAPAVAQDWSPGSGSGDPGWTDPSGSGDPGSTDPGAGDQGPSDSGSGDQGWNQSQGDPQEPQQTWNQSPPVDQPDGQWPANGNGGDRGNGPGGAGDWPQVAPLPISKTPTVAGKTAMIRRNGLAAIPRGAPKAVRAILVAANQIIGKPYKWGGGHGRLFDSGYDCSGSVSYALIRSGLLGYPMVSGTLAHWGLKGAGKYVTIFANKAHVYIEVAGLRLDTSEVGDPSGKSGVRWRPPIGKRFGFAVRHITGL